MNRNLTDTSRELSRQGLSDLEWLAFQFLAEELDETARDTFERLLESDVDAQIAVAKMVELTMQTASAFQRFPMNIVGASATVPPALAIIPGVELATEQVRQSSIQNLGQGWLSPISVLAAVAATLLIGLAVWQYSTENTMPNSTENTMPSSDNQLALVWAENVIEEAELAAEDQEFDDDTEFAYGEDETDNWLASAMSYLDEDDLGHLQ